MAIQVSDTDVLAGGQDAYTGWREGVRQAWAPSRGTPKGRHTRSQGWQCGAHGRPASFGGWLPSRWPPPCSSSSLHLPSIPGLCFYPTLPRPREVTRGCPPDQTAGEGAGSSSSSKGFGSHCRGVTGPGGGELVKGPCGS